MFRHYTFLFLLILACCGWVVEARAQGDFRPEYVVTASGDTLRGEVAYSGAPRSARMCRFRPAATYNAGQLRGYGLVGGQRYDARQLLRADSAGYALPPRPVLLEVLVAGPVVLYYTLNATGNDVLYVARAATGPVQELVPSAIGPWASKPAPSGAAVCLPFLPAQTMCCATRCC